VPRALIRAYHLATLNGALIKVVEKMDKEKIEQALNKIRPMLQAEGGNVELVSIEDNTVKVRLSGACAGCPMSQMTLTQGVERIVKEEVPEVEKVVAV